MCELIEGTGDELYQKILDGSVTGRSFAFNDDGYKKADVAVKWKAFAAKFLPDASPFERLDRLPEPVDDTGDA